MTLRAPVASRRVAVCSAVAFVLPKPAAQATPAQEQLQSLNAGSRKINSEIGDGDLVTELLRRTEANKDRNAALVKQKTEANSFTAIDGTLDRRLVRDLDGQNRYLDSNQIRQLTL